MNQAIYCICLSFGGGEKALKNVDYIYFNCYTDKYGNLVPIEGNENIPFEIERIYYIYDVEKNVRRGFHAHNDLEQVLICIHGNVKILVESPIESKQILLDNPTMGLYIGPMIWREMFDFSDDAVLLVLASKHYDVNDYIRDHELYLKIAKEYFKINYGG